MSSARTLHRATVGTDIDTVDVVIEAGADFQRAMERSVLIVDDDRAIVAALADLLRDEGYRVRMAFDGLSALAESELSPPDLVLSDIAMPKLNGIALARRLRERGVPVVLLSAAVSDPRIADVPFIAKPFDLEHILGLVERIIGEPSRD